MKSLKSTMRLIHHYLGFFLAGVFVFYALSGIVLIFRDTDFFKTKQNIVKTFATHLTKKQLGDSLKTKKIETTLETDHQIIFKDGIYSKDTGIVVYSINHEPKIIKKISSLHKAKSRDPLYFLNIFFGVALLFLAVSSFFMYNLSMPRFRIEFLLAAAGMILTLLLVFFSDAE